jgi:hypothetical protein
MIFDQRNTPGSTWHVVIKILPDEIFAQACAIKEKTSDLRWEMGRLANTIYAYSKGNALPYTRSEVCGAVAHFLDDARSMSSIELYARVADFFPQEVQEAYGFLPFSHFVYAMQFDDQWRTILDYSRDETDKRGGLPPSVAFLEHYFEKERMEIQESQSWPGDEQNDDPGPAYADPIPSEKTEDKEFKPLDFLDIDVGTGTVVLIDRLSDTHRLLTPEEARVLGTNLITAATNAERLLLQRS